MLERHPDVKADIDTILDCFGGADGGGGFVRLCRMLDRFADEAAQGDQASQELLLVVKRMARLINIANGKSNG